MPMITLSGVRSSRDTETRNLDWASLAANASASVGLCAQFGYKTPLNLQKQ
jgi:hypothetical protein